MAKAQTMTPEQTTYFAGLVAIEYIDSLGGFGDVKIKKTKATKDLLGAIRFIDMEEYLLIKEWVELLLPKSNKKFSCIVCNKKVSILAAEYRARHCYECKESFTQLARLKTQEVGRQRRLRIRATNNGTITAKKLKKMLEDQEYKCVECKKDITEHKHLDHIKPLARGGKHTIRNVRYLCPKCNMAKHAKLEWKYEG